jgi:hypothetical protein
MQRCEEVSLGDHGFVRELLRGPQPAAGCGRPQLDERFDLASVGRQWLKVFE